MKLRIILGVTLSMGIPMYGAAASQRMINLVSAGGYKPLKLPPQMVLAERLSQAQLTDLDNATHVSTKLGGQDSSSIEVYIACQEAYGTFLKSVLKSVPPNNTEDVQRIMLADKCLLEVVLQDFPQMLAAINLFTSTKD